MKTWSALTLAVAAAALVACGPAADDFWFHGGLDDATRVAGEKDTLVFVEFYTDWCSWCRRLETETLTDRAVRAELDALVAIRLDAEKGGAEAARRFGVESYPTMVFLDADGDEVDRIVGYLPPEKFVGEVRRITAGDTLAACLRELEAHPADPDAIRRAVAGLLERGDPEGAIAKIESFHNVEGHDHALCERLLFEAGRDLHYRVYLRAARLYRDGWSSPLEVPPVPGSRHLSELLDAGLVDLDPAEQAELLRTARFEDAGELLGMVTLDRAAGDELFELGSFAFRGGHYGQAAELYRRWFDDEAATHDPERLNRAAWQLYLARESVDTAVAMARAAYAAEPSPDIADTLARLLYLEGSHAEAIGLARTAAAEAGGARAEEYLEVVRRMEANLELEDAPAFESYPGPREIRL